eukprot:2222614-Pleurochrysis_carterae.AAC.2
MVQMIVEDFHRIFQILRSHECLRKKALLWLANFECYYFTCYIPQVCKASSSPGVKDEFVDDYPVSATRLIIL